MSLLPAAPALSPETPEEFRLLSEAPPVCCCTGVTPGGAPNDLPWPAGAMTQPMDTQSS